MTIYEFIGNVVAEIPAVKKYHFGSYKYVQSQMLQAISNSNYKTDYFPMVVLVKEPGDKWGIDLPDGKQSYTLRLIIATYTKRNYTNPERLTNVFNPILIPIYNELISKLKVYYSDETSRLPHESEDHFLYSAEAAKNQNKLSENLDAIEITDLDFIIDLNSCSLNN